MNRLLLIICLFYMVGCNDCEQEKSEYDPALHLSSKDLWFKAIELALFKNAHYRYVPTQPYIEDEDGHSIAYLDTTNIKKFLQDYTDSDTPLYYPDTVFIDSYYYDIKKKRHYFLIVIITIIPFNDIFETIEIGGGYYTTNPKNGKIVDKKLKFYGEGVRHFCMKIARKAFEEMIAEREITPYKYSKSYNLRVIDKTIFMKWKQDYELRHKKR